MGNHHAILGPSSCYRWSVCTPSARFEEQIPEEDNEFSEEGTIAHDLAALVSSLRCGVFNAEHAFFSEWLASIMERAVTFYVDKGYTDAEAKTAWQTMYDHAEAWAALLVEYGGTVWIERRYDLSKYFPLSFGTADGTNITPDVLYVSDYKYGEGVRVAATVNKQLMCYGLGALLKAREIGENPTTVVLTIFQPRAGGKSTWEIAADDLVKWAESVKPAAELAIAGQGEFKPGKHCQFCRARTSCAAYFEMFKDVKGVYDKRVMTPKDRATVLRYGGLVKSWINKIEAEAVKLLEKKQSIPGFKLVAGQGRRQFINEDNVVDILLGAGFDSDQIFNPSLRSLTDLEKSLGARLFNEMFASEIITKEGQPQVAPEDDDRPAIGRSAADDYDDEYEDLL